MVAPSASLATTSGPTGGYLLYDVERDEASGVWRIGYELRAFDAGKEASFKVGRGELGALAA